MSSKTSDDSSGQLTSAAATPSGELKHMSALDGVRGLAILLVVVFHTYRFHSDDSLINLVGVFPRFGWAGVDLFFVLSGFLITRILLQSRSRQNYFPVFYVRRSLRIIPLYVAVVFFALFVSPQAYEVPPDAVRHQVWLWTFLSNWLLAFEGNLIGGLAITWSLAVEEQFYLLWPLLIRKLQNKTLVRVCLGMQVVSIITRLFAVFAMESPEATYNMTICRMDALSVGALLALHHHDPLVTRFFPSLIKRIVPVCIAALIAILVSVGSFAAFSKPMQVIGYTCIAWCWGGMLARIIWGTGGRGRLVVFFESRFLVLLGTLSYGIYLLHTPMQLFIWDNLFEGYLSRGTGSDFVGQGIYTGVTLLLSVGAAWVSYRIFEGPILRLKRHFPYR